MSESVNNFKILIILSEEYNKEIIKKCHLSSKNGYLNFSNFIVEYLIDPTRLKLEQKILKTEYLCIIPCTPYCFEKIDYELLKTYSFNILDLLNKNNMNYFGNNYISQIILNDKISYLRTSKIGLPAKLFTKYYFEKILNKEEILEYLPMVVEPLYSKDYISTQKYIIDSEENLKKQFCKIFDTHNKLDELIIYKHIEESDKIVVTILGTPPYSNCLIYSSTDYSKMDNASLDELSAESHKLFELYSLNDFAQFEYLYDKIECKYYLSDINCSNCFNEYLLSVLENQYCMSFEAIINLTLITYLIKEKPSDEIYDLIATLIKTLPNSLINNILPLDFRRKMQLEINYHHICSEIKKNFLKPDESNKLNIVKQLFNTLKQLPTLSHIDSPFLGNRNDKHEFLRDYYQIPEHPQNPQNILDTSIKILNGQTRWHAPTMLNNIDPPIMLSTIAASAITNLYNPSAMESSSSAGYLKMEKQIVQQMSTLIGWDVTKSAGTFTSGGKNCLSYAIKCGLNRCKVKESKGVHPIVITSEINHYSVESCCYQLGLAKEDCVRIPVNETGTIDFEAFENVVRTSFMNNTPIACIIFSGGNTTHCPVENIKIGVDIVQNLVNSFKITYSPYIYYDFVVGWPWLFFKEYDFETNKLKISKNVLDKIQCVTNNIKYTYLADGVGIDFHKLGFSPLQNSLFMNKNSIDLYSLMKNDVEPEFREPYHYTFCNSRGATHIISAWNVLQSIGIEGFQSYIANMLNITQILGTELSKYNFEIIKKDETYGFTTIIWSTYDCDLNFNSFVKLDGTLILKNNRYLHCFAEFLKENHNPGYFLRFLPNYKVLKSEERIAALSIFPTNLNLDENKAKSIARNIGELKLKFDELYSNDLFEYYGQMPNEVPK